MVSNRFRLEHPVIFFEYVVNIVPLIILPKQINVTCIKKIFFPRIDIAISFFAFKLSVFHWLEEIISLTIIMETINSLKTRNLYKNPHQDILLLIMRHQPSNV